MLSGALADTSEIQRAHLLTLRNNALRMQKLVNALLDYARIEAGRVEATYEPVDIGLLTRDLASTFCSAVHRARLLYIINCPSIDEPVYIDRDMWEKIVLNLLSNALKFTFKGVIEVSLKPLDDGIVLAVRDYRQRHCERSNCRICWTAFTAGTPAVHARKRGRALALRSSRSWSD